MLERFADKIGKEDIQAEFRERIGTIVFEEGQDGGVCVANALTEALKGSAVMNLAEDLNRRILEFIPSNMEGI